MKRSPVSFLRQIGSVLAAAVRAGPWAAAKNKAALTKARLMILGLLPNKKLLMGAISSKILALRARESEDDCCSKAMVMYRSVAEEVYVDRLLGYVGEDDQYPDLTHCLFDSDDEEEEEEEEEEDAVDSAYSAIDLVRSAREDEAEFNLEDEIDHVADVFIRRFRRQMRRQKQDSIERSA